VQKQWDKIRKGVNEFGSYYMAVKRMELTGNPSDEDMISAAMARFCGANVYETIRKDRTADKAKQVHCPWVPCWRVLRPVDKFSGAAGAAAADGGAAGAGSASGSPGGRSTSDSDEDGEDAGAGGYQSRPRGPKAAKREKAAGIQESRMFKVSNDALSALAQTTSERTTVAFFHSAEMRDTPEAVAFRCAHARKLMAAGGLVLSLPDTLSEASPPPASTGDAPVAGESTPSTPTLTSSSTPRMPPAQAPPAGTGVVPASTTAASAPGDAPPASAVKTTTATVSSPAASATGSGAPGGAPPASAVEKTTATVSSPAASAAGSGAASRGRRLLSTKQSKAAVALAAGSKTLDDENYGIYVAPVFPVRDDGADCAADRQEAEGDDSSDNYSNAEYQYCVRMHIGQRLQRFFFSPLGRFLVFYLLRLCVRQRVSLSRQSRVAHHASSGRYLRDSRSAARRHADFAPMLRCCALRTPLPSARQ